MGILNVTPDSFSDGGRYFSVDTAVDHAEKMVLEGAQIIDIGGESTRPGSARIDLQTELARVIPIVKTMSKRPGIIVSIDTYKPEVALAAIKAGAQVVNDITGGHFDPRMYEIVAENRVGYIMMHMQGSPETMQQNPVYDDVIRDIYVYFQAAMENAHSIGIQPEQIVLDPGIGFGKTVEHNLTIIRRLNEFATLKRPILIGVSRKSFIDKISPSATSDRIPGSLVAGIISVQHGCQILRVHDVAETVQALRMYDQLKDA